MACPTAVALRSGDLLPRVGLGVYKALPRETEEAVASALALGYRHVDTAQIYGNEAEVGRAVSKFEEATGERVWITTKARRRPCGVLVQPLHAGSAVPYSRARQVWKSAWGNAKCREAVNASAEKLPHIDLILLHAPGEPAQRAETWRALEECAAGGLVRNIGVSNFSVVHLKKLAETASVIPAVNQIEVHPFLQRRELVAFCEAQGIVVEAYSPLTKARALDNATLAAVAQEARATPAQVLLRWSLQKGFVTLPKSVNPERQAENLSVYSFALTQAQMDTLDGLESNMITGWDPITQDAV
jgi:diketogulonate reductase-like aldo/keto reductase